MDNGAQDVYTDPLFVGLTRPATMWGIPYTAFVIEFMATTLIFLAIGNPIYLVLAVPIHGCCRRSYSVKIWWHKMASTG